MAFDIRFTEEAEGCSKMRRGEIVLDDFAESFESPLEFWTAAHYEQQWTLGVKRLVNGEPKSALVTAMYPPDRANFLLWWVMYRCDNLVIFRNHMLLEQQLGEPIELAKLYSFIPERAPSADEQYPISEWSVQFDEVKSFLGRGTAQSVQSDT